MAKIGTGLLVLGTVAIAGLAGWYFTAPESAIAPAQPASVEPSASAVASQPAGAVEETSVAAGDQSAPEVEVAAAAARAPDAELVSEPEVESPVAVDAEPVEAELVEAEPVEAEPEQQAALAPVGAAEDPEPAAETTTEPAAANPSEQSSQDLSQGETAAAPAEIVPGFDVVRVDQDGQTVIAGSARPGSLVEIMLDGEVVGTALADARGSFVGIVAAALSDRALQLQIRTRKLAISGPAAETAAVSPEASSTQAPATKTVPEGSASTAGVAVTEDTTTGAVEPDDSATAAVQTDEPAPQGQAEAASTPVEDPAPQTAPQTAEQSEPQTAEQSAEQTTAQQPAAVVSSGRLTPSSRRTVVVAPEVSPAGAASQEAEVTAEPSVADAAPAADPVTRGPEVNAPAPSTAGAADAAAPVVASPAEVPVVEELAVAALSPESTPELPEPEPGYSVSAPVIILPSLTLNGAPALLQPREEEAVLLQPLGTASAITLDAIRYGDTGAVKLTGRGVPGRAVRIYGNGQSLGATGILENGTWAWALAQERARDIQLFRFDELDDTGVVTSRIETPFTYSRLSPKVLRERRVVIQRGDMLWRIAEQFYGEGLRYSVIYGANSGLIRDPDLIYPGQVFSIPELVDAQ